VGDRDVPLAISIDDDNVVDANRFDHTAIELTIDRGQDDLLGSVFGIKEAVPQRVTPSSRRTRRCLLGVEGVIQAVPKRPPQPNQIRMP
jgi:hypothetical protein